MSKHNFVWYFLWKILFKRRYIVLISQKKKKMNERMKISQVVPWKLVAVAKGLLSTLYVKKIGIPEWLETAKNTYSGIKLGNKYLAHGTN